MIAKYNKKSKTCILLTVLIAIIFLPLGPVSAQVVKPSRNALSELDNFISNHIKKSNIPGALVAVVSKGKTLHLETYGMANVELNVPVSENSVFEIGSISKQFVTAAVMLMSEENKIDIDDPIHKYLSYLPGEWLGITVRQLMTHTSGIPDYEEIRTYDAYRYRFTPEEIIKIAHSRPVDFAPGTGYYYSNTGYFLLSMIVERIDGKPLNQILKSRIWDPLGMSQTRMANPETIIPNRAAGYWVNKTNVLINRNPTETSSTLGAGGILSSAADLSKWDNALYGNELLSASSKEKMWTPVTLPNGTISNYGFGWNLRPYKGLKSVNHSGQVAGFTAYFYRFPEQEVTFIVFSNRYRTSLSPIRTALIHTFIPSLGPIK